MPHIGNISTAQTAKGLLKFIYQWFETNHWAELVVAILLLIAAVVWPDLKAAFKGTPTDHDKDEDKGVKPRGIVANITGSFSIANVIRSGVIIENREDRQKWVACGLSVNVTLYASSTVIIQNIRLATHNNKPICCPLKRLASLPVPKLDPSGIFVIEPEMEYLYDGARALPSSLELEIVDELGAKHTIPLKDGATLPTLPPTTLETLRAE